MSTFDVRDTMPDSESSPAAAAAAAITRRQLLADFGAAATASFAAAPLVTTIDSAITKTAANAGSAHGPAILKEALVLRQRPINYITSVPNRWLFMLFWLFLLLMLVRPLKLIFLTGSPS